MHRWHTKACRAPDVQVLPGKRPQCNACGQAPRLSDLIANNKPTSSIPRIPPDVPLGELNLWWPRSVLYLSSDPQSPSPHAKPAPQLQGDPEGESSATPIEANSPYQFPLGVDEFRLICLPAAPSPNYPIHLRLEVHDLENCPEYETVSYAWAGEDGDGTLCKPVYVGPYWDILLQTRNCWEMLRFMRPRRWTRLFWVDAICINQSNVRERNMQVANMRRIYSASSRVVIYLGPEIAMPLHDKYPRRRKLHELESGTVEPNFFPSQQSSSQVHNSRLSPPPPHKLSDLLRRRYFSRIWVIQELLLSKNVVLRVGDVDFWADASMATDFSSKVPHWDWGATPAAWLQHMAKGTENVRDLKELLSITRLSRATDPRDRIFGLLGIMPDAVSINADGNGSDVANQANFQADYSLTCQHVFIGLFAHCLINLQQPDILFHAAGVSSNLIHYPSWAPNWTSTVTWKILFQSPNLTSESVFDELRKLIKEGYATDKISQGSMDDRRFDLCELRGPGKPEIIEKRHWNSSSYIDSSSGSLSLFLTHYMYLTERLDRIGSHNRFHIFATHIGEVSVYLLSEHRLDNLISIEDQFELFILNRDDHSFIYLLTRLEYNDNGEELHSLVAACPFVFVLMPADLSTNEIPSIRSLPLRELQFSVHDFVQDFQSNLDTALYQNVRYQGLMEPLFPSLTKMRDVLPVVKMLYAQETFKEMMFRNRKNSCVTLENFVDKDAFANALVSCINKVYEPRVVGDDILITLSTTWKEVCGIYILRKNWRDRHHSSDEMMWEYRPCNPESVWESPVLSSSKYKKLLLSGQEKFFDIRFKAHDALTLMLEGSYVPWLIGTIQDLSTYINETGESLWALLSGEVDEACHFRACPHLGRRNRHVTKLCDAVEVDGSTFMVTLV